VRDEDNAGEHKDSLQEVLSILRVQHIAPVIPEPPRSKPGAHVQPGTARTITESHPPEVFASIRGDGPSLSGVRLLAKAGRACSTS
jgi:hypothetical protein